ncbi:MAG TPA: hypothetical protein VGM77_13870 [Gemmatimonadales bacterium]
MIALLLALARAPQDTNLVILPRVRAMLESFPPPRPGDVSIATRFSRDTVWVGEQVEFVTVAWFPRPLRDRLRHQPVLTSPSLNGLWSARAQLTPVQLPPRMVGHVMYDLWVTYQTIFPLAAGRVEAPPAVLTYGVPTSTSYFAPEDRRTVAAAPAVLVARAIPASLAASLGSGPTARNLSIGWRATAGGLQAGSPAIVELDVTGEGNLTLWPAPDVHWPDGLHVYPEPTDERAAPVLGVIGGQKHFRYTVVADSAGVLAFPAVSYPYFDPRTGTVQTAVTAPLSLAIRPRLVTEGNHSPLPVTADRSTPLVTSLVRQWGWLLLIVALALPIATRARRPARRPRFAQPNADAEAALRAALGTPVDAGPDHVVAALRARGVPRDDAELVRRWLTALTRVRYGPDGGASPDAPAALTRVLDRLRGVTTALVLLLCLAGSLAARQDDGIARYNAGDYAGAARRFAGVVAAHPTAAGTWRNLGAARWMNGDEVGATAAWLHAATLAPRDPLLDVMWARAVSVPPDIRSLAPTVPLTRDEELLLAWALWLVAWTLALKGKRSWALGVGACCLVFAILGVSRWLGDTREIALITAATPVRISPNPATMAEAEFPAWTMIHVRRRVAGWDLIEGSVAGQGGLGSTVAGWVPAAAVAAVAAVD